MSKYTTEVRYICEQLCGLQESKGFNDINSIIKGARSAIFNFKYPIFDSAYKEVLETKILKHYYMREIGLETVGLWKHYLDMKMNEIMPYYNKLYESELLAFNPFYDVDLNREHTVTKEGTKHDNGERVERVEDREIQRGNTHSSQEESEEVGCNSYYSDTPQGGVSGLKSLNYLTNATMNDSNNNAHITGDTETTNDSEKTIRRNDSNTNFTTASDTETYLENVKGKNGGTSYSKLLEEYRATFLNIDKQIIDELSVLFMGIW